MQPGLDKGNARHARGQRRKTLPSYGCILGSTKKPFHVAVFLSSLSALHLAFFLEIRVLLTGASHSPYPLSQIDLNGLGRRQEYLRERVSPPGVEAPEKALLDWRHPRKPSWTGGTHEKALLNWRHSRKPPELETPEALEKALPCS